MNTQALVSDSVYASAYILGLLLLPDVSYFCNPCWRGFSYALKQRYTYPLLVGILLLFRDCVWNWIGMLSCSRSPENSLCCYLVRSSHETFHVNKEPWAFQKESGTQLMRTRNPLDKNFAFGTSEMDLYSRSSSCSGNRRFPFGGSHHLEHWWNVKVIKREGPETLTALLLRCTDTVESRMSWLRNRKVSTNGRPHMLREADWTSSTEDPRQLMCL